MTFIALILPFPFPFSRSRRHLAPWSPGSPGHRDLVHPVDQHVVLEPQLLGRLREGQGGDAAVQRAVDDLEFDPGQRLAETLMDAVAERDVMTCGAADVEGVRIREGRLVAVGDVAGGDDALPRADE